MYVFSITLAALTNSSPTCLLQSGLLTSHMLAIHLKQAFPLALSAALSSLLSISFSFLSPLGH